VQNVLKSIQGKRESAVDFFLAYDRIRISDKPWISMERRGFKYENY
jgi:hypothetical protein